MILDGTLLRIDRVGMTSGGTAPTTPEAQMQGLNVQAVADPAGLWGIVPCFLARPYRTEPTTEVVA